MEQLTERGCEPARVAPLVSSLYSSFPDEEAWSRGFDLQYFYGARAVPRLRSCPPALMGLFDRDTPRNTLSDRIWAARWVPLREAMEVATWRYNYRRPYTGAPVWVWYIDNHGREVKRPYEEG